MAQAGGRFQDLNRQKADLSDVYDRPDPRGYYDRISALDYVIPSRAKPVFTRTVAALARRRGLTVPTLADLGCSYGVNAALLKYGLELEQLYARYRRPEMRTASVAETICGDLEFYRTRPQHMDVNVVGIDAAREAVGYAKAVGILDDAIAANYESAEPEGAAARLLSGIDMVMSTGCVGYVSERTFGNLLAQSRRQKPWVASFVLRIFPYAPIERVLAAHGLVTECLGEPVPQRRFASFEERRAAVEAVRALGRDPAGLEAEGWYYADFYLSRPADEAAALPLARLLEC